jgi:hypothetical protein
MSQRSQKVVFRVATGLLTVIVLMFVANSIFNREIFANRFLALGYPTYIIYPLAVAKILGLIAIWSNRSLILKEWAYAGFFFNFVLAFMAELQAQDGELFSTPIGLLCLCASYYSGKAFRKESNAIKADRVLG